MRVIDCDAHVEESVETWQYLDPEFYLLRPIPVVFPEDTCFGTHNAGWVIDYTLEQHPDLIFFLSYPDGRIFDKGHGVIGSAYAQLYADPRFSGRYVHVSAMDAGWGHAHWFVRDDSRYREAMQQTLGELSDFANYSFSD